MVKCVERRFNIILHLFFSPSRERDGCRCQSLADFLFSRRVDDIRFPGARRSCGGSRFAVFLRLVANPPSSRRPQFLAAINNHHNMPTAVISINSTNDMLRVHALRQKSDLFILEDRMTDSITTPSITEPNRTLPPPLSSLIHPKVAEKDTKNVFKLTFLLFLLSFLARFLAFFPFPSDSSITPTQKTSRRHFTRRRVRMGRPTIHSSTAAATDQHPTSLAPRRRAHLPTSVL